MLQISFDGWLFKTLFLESGFYGWSTEIMTNNTGPAFTDGNNWFTVLGVYFPTVTGVMAGIK